MRCNQTAAAGLGVTVPWQAAVTVATASTGSGIRVAGRANVPPETERARVR